MINLGVNYEDVKDEDQFPTVPDGDYPCVVEKFEETTSGPNSKVPGRPMIKWSLAITHPDTMRRMLLTYNTVLPWIPTGTTELDMSGVGMLVALCKGLGKPWTGAEMEPADYVGRSGTIKVELKNRQKLNGMTHQWEDDPDGGKINNVKGFVY